MPSARGPRQELADATAHGDVYLRRLRRGQLVLALLTLAAFGGLIGSLPLVLDRIGSLSRARVLGIPIEIPLLTVAPFPLFLVLAWLHERRARALDEAFRDLVDE